MAAYQDPMARPPAPKPVAQPVGAAFFKPPKIGPMPTPPQPPLGSYYQANGTGGGTGVSLGGYPAKLATPQVYTNQGVMRPSQYNPGQAAANFTPASSGVNAPAGISKMPTQSYTPQPPADMGQSDAGPMQVQTSIQPVQPYSQQDTDQAWAKARNRQSVLGNHQWNMKQFRNDASGAAQAAPQEAEYAAQAALLNATIPFQDAYENTLSQRIGEQNRDAEANQLAQLGLQGQNIAFNDQQSRQSAMLRALLGQV